MDVASLQVESYNFCESYDQQGGALPFSLYKVFLYDIISLQLSFEVDREGSAPSYNYWLDMRLLHRRSTKL